MAGDPFKHVPMIRPRILVPTIAEARVMIRDGVKAIPAATVIALTFDERKALEALAGSRKSEARMRDRARIVLLAAFGLGSGAVAREVGCTAGHRVEVTGALRRSPNGGSQ